MDARNGRAFDAFQVNALAQIVKEHKAGGTPIESGALWRKLHERFKECCEINPYYRRTPAVFGSTTVFYVQTVKAFKAAGVRMESLDQALTYIYQNVIYLNISCMPDVDMSSAARILRQTKFAV